jgi:beta-lactamase superfamily II metal-dependent hydrolase
VDTLRVRAYNVRFGDAILVTVPDRDPATQVVTTRHILVDMGNVLSGEGGQDAVFKPAVDDIISELNGKALDLYVMTHEHLDHIQGLYYVASKVYPGGEFAQKLKVDYAWITASAAEDYYDTHEEARKQKLRADATYHALERYFAAAALTIGEPFRTFLLNNSPSSTAECVAFLRKLARKTAYVYRGIGLAGKHPFREATFKIWAPEEDTSDYYGRFQPMALGVAEPNGADESKLTTPRPPAGVDAGAFYGLVDARRRGVGDNMLAIDQAANNTSVVFSLHWRGWTLLFPGDAEQRSWRTMAREQVLEPVHFLKVAHHGSHNGTPDGDILEAILPLNPADARPRTAVISTYTDTYPGIPHDPTNKKLKTRCTLYTTLAKPTKPHVDLTFQG